MELDDCAFPLLAGIVQTDDAERGLRRRQLRPARRLPAPHARAWSAGDLLEANGAIFTVAGQGPRPTTRRADVRILVVGNPANTNCLIAMNNAPNIARRALHGHDPPRPQPGHRPAGGQDRHDRSPTSPSMTIWGNHSATQYPDLFHAEVDGKNAAERDRRPGLDRGRRSSRPCSSAARPSSRPAALSSAASAANAAIDHVRTWVLGHGRGRLGGDGHPVRRLLRRARGPDVVVPGDHARAASTSIVQGLDIDDFSRGTHRRLRGRAGRGARHRRELGLI